VSSAEATVHAALAAASGLTALVGTRIYQEQEPQAAELPYLVFHRIATTPYGTMAGDTGSARVTVQVDVLASTVSSLKALTVQVRKAMQTAASFQDQNDDPEPERGLYRSSLDFYVHEEVSLS